MPHASNIPDVWGMWDGGLPGTPFAVEFNGATTVINCGSDVDIDDVADNEVTAEAWIRATSEGETTGRIFEKTGSSSAGWFFWVAPTGLNAQVYCAGTNAVTSETTSELLDGKWHHVAVVLPRSSSPNISDVQLYVDGQLVSPASVEPMPLHTGHNTDGALPLMLGRAVVPASARFRGDMDAVFVFDRLLSDTEVHRLMLGENITQPTIEHAGQN